MAPLKPQPPYSPNNPSTTAPCALYSLGQIPSIGRRDYWKGLVKGCSRRGNWACGVW